MHEWSLDAACLLTVQDKDFATAACLAAQQEVVK
jgi:hypothetical protein